MKLTITFNADTVTKQMILQMMGYEVDTEGYITRDFIRQPSLCDPDVHIEDFAGLVKLSDRKGDIGIVKDIPEEIVLVAKMNMGETVC